MRFGEGSGERWGEAVSGGAVLGGGGEQTKGGIAGGGGEQRGGIGAGGCEQRAV